MQFRPLAQPSKRASSLVAAQPYALRRDRQPVIEGDEATGANMVFRALDAPARQIASMLAMRAQW